MSFIKKLESEGKIPIFYILAKDLDGNECHYFIQTTKTKIKELKKDTLDQITVSQFGKIIASGFGKEPSDITLDFLKMMYGITFKLD